jgi:hypothetical protein
MGRDSNISPKRRIGRIRQEDAEFQTPGNLLTRDENEEEG